MAERPAPFPKTIHYAPLPMNNPAFNLAKSQVLTQYLQAKLHIQVIPKLYDNYEDILTAFQQGEVELIELGPLVYFTLQSQTEHATPLVSVKHHPQEEYYQCVLAAPIDGINHLESPPTQPAYKVALTQPLSTCGWLMTQHLLEKHGLHLETLPSQYLGSHEAVAMALIRKEHQIGGLARFIAERYANLGLRILDTSEPLPQFIMVANNAKLSADERNALQAALLDYRSNEQTPMGIYGFNPFSEKLFDRFQSIVAQNPHTQQYALKQEAVHR
ncbi:phosphate/phosphite/phosphonate ABC transporter substrate-binding protein [Thiomicrorhabdus cannonii]|uniref:phosphate/phosphite/phosphonate ABC transporter substrate-binding protein n=1 Tax=Thiomicrorhabdus cannonii TaxID=2748011 RepID=UPI0015C03B48|nr:phosphate/phosphite/phosphonate ABC transporter substrate-binding protein [Thiomicrorhabdus cannonii]